MQQSKNSISTNYIKKKDLVNVTPFDAFNSLTKQRNPTVSNFLTSSRKKSNRSLLDCEENTLSNSHLCLKHSFPISHVCFTCNFYLMCSQCNKISHLQTNQHDIRSLQKSSTFIKNTLIHSQIKLQAKCNILTNINEQLNDHKIELYNEKNDYKQELEKTFQYLHQVLDIKMKEMNQEIQDIYVQNDKKFAETIDQIKALQGYYEKCQQSISQTLEMGIQNNNDFSICNFYSYQRNTIQDIIKESELKQFKKNIYEVKYKIENSEINSIIKSLNEIEIGYDIKYMYFDTQVQTESRPASLKKILSKVKSENELRTKPSKKKIKKPIKYLDLEKTQKVTYVDSRLQKQRQSHKINGTFCTSTPKQNVSRDKKFDMLKKSPDGSTALLKKRKKSFGKMISMPVSPAKEQTQERNSPSAKTKDYIPEGMKKKTTLTKKKK